ncbi:MarR family winged helix-turn-helix transcriptional regulator [Amycolatopsis benzoatilytica]|uniref:MarR family winged helix-turn-helix transcriptional regulator n=1 Tax=Amycolatopsis benzoatilytica TaxID=346045 RepID=UPI00037A7D2F|nr:MarR family transcriptional regulator [Amycolatopsis benzoatilytica]
MQALPDEVADLERLTRVLVAVAWDSAHAAPRGVTFPQVRLLVVLDSLGCTPCSRLAEAMGVNASSVTRLADKLEAHGYVARGVDEHRRTVVTVEVTPAGREVVAGVVDRRHRALAELLAELPAERRATVSTAVGDLLSAAEAAPGVPTAGPGRL